jgi:predicted NBD/HSP70 family sugar kinase
VEAIGRAATGGDREARALLDDVGRELGHAAAWLLQIAGSDTLVIAGGLSSLGSLLMEPLREGLRESAMVAVAETVNVRRSFLDSRGKLRGAILIALQQIDEPRSGFLT